MAAEPFSDVGISETLLMAIDHDFLAEKFVAGAQLPSYNLVSAGMEGNTSPLVNIAGMDQLEREDAAKALRRHASLNFLGERCCAA